jgi:ABC-type sugar transport system permease subunit
MSAQDVVRSITQQPIPQRKLPRQDKYAPYFFISPFYLLFTIFFLLPTVFALVLGFLKWNSMGAPEWFALRNYERLFGDEVFWQSVGNTAFYCAASLFVIVLFCAHCDVSSGDFNCLPYVVQP